MITVLQTGKIQGIEEVFTLRECMHYRGSPGSRGYVDMIFRVIQSYEEDKRTGKWPQ